jgi:hypothetical protein
MNRLNKFIRDLKSILYCSALNHYCANLDCQCLCHKSGNGEKREILNK